MTSKSRPQLLLADRDGDVPHAHSHYARRWRLVLNFTLTCLLLWFWYLHIWQPSLVTNASTPRIPLKDVPSRLQSFQDCSIEQLYIDTDLDFLSTASPIALSEFVLRRDRLAQALVDDGLDAFIVEPGYTFQYFANVGHCIHFV